MNNNIKFSYTDPLYNEPRTLIIKGEFDDLYEELVFKIKPFALREFVLTAKAMGLDINLCSDEMIQPVTVNLPVGVKPQEPEVTDFNAPETYVSEPDVQSQPILYKVTDKTNFVDPTIPDPLPAVELQPSRVLPVLVNKETEDSFKNPLDLEKSPNQNVADIIRGELESELNVNIRKEFIELDLDTLGLCKCFLTDLEQENILYVDKIFEENDMYKVKINDFTYSFPDKNNMKMNIFNKTDSFRFIVNLVENESRCLELDLCKNFKIN